jgi:hypothetical protein
MAKEKDNILRVCPKCNLRVHAKDNYRHIIDYKLGVFMSEAFMHTHCFRDYMHGTLEEKEIKKKANMFMDRALEMVGIAPTGIDL